jgi:hypothetical protein
VVVSDAGDVLVAVFCHCFTNIMQMPFDV